MPLGPWTFRKSWGIKDKNHFMTIDVWTRSKCELITCPCFRYYPKTFCFSQHVLTTFCWGFLMILFIYSYREEGKKKERETSMCDCLLTAPHWGPGLKPRHVPRPGIKLETPWFTGWCSIHWATPVRAWLYFEGKSIIINFESWEEQFSINVFNVLNCFYYRLWWYEEKS